MESTGTLNTTFNIAYVETADENTTTESESSGVTSSDINKVLKEKNTSNVPKSKRSKTSDDTVKSYKNLFKNVNNDDNPSDDSLKDFDTEGIGLGGMHKKKKKTLLKSGSTNTLFTQNL